jgi:hypothetical protein
MAIFLIAPCSFVRHNKHRTWRHSGVDLNQIRLARHAGLYMQFRRAARHYAILRHESSGAKFAIIRHRLRRSSRNRYHRRQQVV